MHFPSMFLLTRLSCGCFSSSQDHPFEPMELNIIPPQAQEAGQSFLPHLPTASERLPETTGSDHTVLPKPPMLKRYVENYDPRLLSIQRALSSVILTSFKSDYFHYFAGALAPTSSPLHPHRPTALLTHPPTTSIMFFWLQFSAHRPRSRTPPSTFALTIGGFPCPPERWYLFVTKA